MSNLLLTPAWALALPQHLQGQGLEAGPLLE